MLTNKGKYGLKAMVHLAGLEPGKPGRVRGREPQAPACDQASRRDLLDGGHDRRDPRGRDGDEPAPADRQVEGFVQSRKGRGGGYILARPAAEIRVGSIVRTLDGALAPFPCASQAFYRRCIDCGEEDSCPVRLMMLEVRAAIAAVLDNRSLAEMRAMPAIAVERLLHHA